MKTLSELVQDVANVEAKARVHSLQYGNEVDQSWAIDDFKAGAASQVPIREALEEAIIELEWLKGHHPEPINRYVAGSLKKIRAILERKGE